MTLSRATPQEISQKEITRANTHTAGDFRIGRLTARQRVVLRLVVKSFIESAGPVGSRFLTEHYDLGVSPATVRGTMNDLETLGFLSQPFTSAGRIPTELGYRAFVDELMESFVLEDTERRTLEKELHDLMEDTALLIQESSRILARFARLLGVVLSPSMNNGILERMEIVQVASDRVMFVISVRGGLIKTIVFNVTTELHRKQLDRLVVLLNERLAGLSLEEIRRTCVPRIQDLVDEGSGLVRLIVDRHADLFSDPPASRTLRLDGTTFILSQPEFSDHASMRNLIELLDDETSMVRLLEHPEKATLSRSGLARVQIGLGLQATESGQESVGNLSVVTAPYTVAGMEGKIGVIGPTRMNYARTVALVEGMAALMSQSGTLGNEA